MIYYGLQNRETGELRTTHQNRSKMPALYDTEKQVESILKRSCFYFDRKEDYDLVKVELRIVARK